MRIFRPRYAVAGRTAGVELGSHGLHRFKAVTCLSYYVPISSITILISVWENYSGIYVIVACCIHIFGDFLKRDFCIQPVCHSGSSGLRAFENERWWKPTTSSKVAKKMDCEITFWWSFSKMSPKNRKIGGVFAKFADHLGDAADVYIRFIFKNGWKHILDILRIVWSWKVKYITQQDGRAGHPNHPEVPSTQSWPKGWIPCATCGLAGLVVYLQGYEPMCNVHVRFVCGHHTANKKVCITANRIFKIMMTIS